MACGGWSNYRALTREDCLVFREATECLCGVRYEPFLVSVQIVAETNFRFICNATSTTNPKDNFIACVSIFKPLPSQCRQWPRVTDICEMTCQKL